MTVSFLVGLPEGPPGGFIVVFWKGLLVLLPEGPGVPHTGHLLVDGGPTAHLDAAAALGLTGTNRRSESDVEVVTAGKQANKRCRTGGGYDTNVGSVVCCC